MGGGGEGTWESAAAEEIRGTGAGGVDARHEKGCGVEVSSALLVAGSGSGSGSGAGGTARRESGEREGERRESPPFIRATGSLCAAIIAVGAI